VKKAPFQKTHRTTKHIMLDVLIALIPATVSGFVYFGLAAFVTVLLALSSAFLSELLFCVIAENRAFRFRAFFRKFDFTSLVTGLLLALSLPASLRAWYLPVLGSAFAVIAVKMLFGGTGKNIVNPAMAGRAFLFLSFAETALYPKPNFSPLLSDPVTGATQLNILLGKGNTLSLPDLFLGTGVAGCIGETCKLAILVGAGYLICRKVIKWYLPLLLLGAEGLCAVALQGSFSAFLPSLLSGGLLLGAFFMATDYVTSPKSTPGNLIYFPLLGILIALLRQAVGTETTSFCILIMNFAVFPIDALCPVRPFGSARIRFGKKEKL